MVVIFLYINNVTSNNIRSCKLNYYSDTRKIYRIRYD